MKTALVLFSLCSLQAFGTAIILEDSRAITADYSYFIPPENSTSKHEVTPYGSVGGEWSASSTTGGYVSQHSIVTGNKISAEHYGDNSFAWGPFGEGTRGESYMQSSIQSQFDVKFTLQEPHKFTFNYEQTGTYIWLASSSCAFQLLDEHGIALTFTDPVLFGDSRAGILLPGDYELKSLFTIKKSANNGESGGSPNHHLNFELTLEAIGIPDGGSNLWAVGIASLAIVAAKKRLGIFSRN